MDAKDTKVFKEASGTKANLADYVVNSGSGRYPDESIIDDVLNLYYNTDKTGAQITKELGITNIEMYRYLDDYGQGPNRVVRGKKSEVKPKVVAMCKSGKYRTMAQIAEEVGVAQGTVSRYLKEEGLSVNPSRSRKKVNTGGRKTEFKRKYMPIVIAEYENNPNLSQAQIADKVGVSQATAGRYIKEYLESKPAMRTGSSAPISNKKLDEARKWLASMTRKDQIICDIISGYSLDYVKEKYNLEGSTFREVLNNINKSGTVVDIELVLGNISDINEVQPKVINLYNSTELSVEEIATQLKIHLYTACLYIVNYEEQKITVY